MYSNLRMLRVKLFNSMEEPTEPTKDGRYSILTRRERLRLRDSMRNSVSTSKDHSTLSQSSHSTELLRASVLITSLLRDGEIMFWLNSGTSMKLLRLSEATNGRTIACTLIAMEEATISELTPE